MTTVSPTYAREILTPEFGFGLEGVLRNRADRLLGILNGIDIDRWNPETDSYLPANYSVIDRSGKLLCKQALQREFQLPESSVPLLGVIARLTSQKGLDLVATIIPQLMEMDLQLVMLGTGEPELEAKFQGASGTLSTSHGTSYRLRRRTRPSYRRRSRYVCDAVAVRAMWPEPALQPSLWNGSRSEKNRWIGRYGPAADCMGSTGRTGNWVSC